MDRRVRQSRLLSIVLTIALLITSMPMGTFESFAAASDRASQKHEIYLNGTKVSDSFTFNYGDEVDLELRVDGDRTSADFLMIDTSTTGDIEEAEWDEFSNIADPGSYYLGYIANLEEGGEAHLTRDISFTVSKAPLNKLKVSWEGNTAKWTTTQADLIGDYSFTLYKNGEVVRGYDSKSVQGTSVDCSSAISGKNYGEYTFGIVANPSSEASKHYASSAKATSGVNKYDESVAPRIVAYGITVDGSKLHVTGQDEGSGVAYYAFSTAKNAADVKASEWKSVSITTEVDTYTEAPTAVGSYYAYLKDVFGNTVKSDAAINVSVVKFNGISKASQVILGDNKELQLSTSEKKNGYVLEGWYADEAKNNKITKVVSTDKPTTINVYANWERSDFNASINVAGNPDKTYDGKAVVLEATSDADVEVAWQWYKDGQAISGATAATLSLRNVSDSGSYSVIGKTNVDGMLKEASTDAKAISIRKAPLTVIIAPTSVVYGSAVPSSFSHTFIGFVNGETEASAGITGALTTDYTSGASVRSEGYAINADSLNASNYNINGEGVLTVTPKASTDLTVELGQNKFAFQENNEGFEPTVTVKDGEYTLLEGTDYTLEYSNNVNVTDNALVTIIFRGNYKGTRTASFVIEPGTFRSEVGIEDADSWVYGDEAHRAYVSNAGSGGEIKYYYRAKGEDEESAGAWSTAQPKNAGAYQVKAVFAATDNYKEVETAPLDFTIKPKEIHISTGVSGVTSWTYDGKSHKNTSYEITSGEMLGTDSIKKVDVTGSITDVGTITTKTNVEVSASTVASNYRFVVEETELTVKAAKIVTPIVSWVNGEHGVASWVVTSNAKDTEYKVDLFYGDEVIATETTTDTSVDFVDAISRNATSLSEGGSYRFKVQAISRDPNYKDSDVSKLSDEEYVLLVNVTVGDGVDDASFKDEARSKILFEGDTAAIVSTLKEGYQIDGPIWSALMDGADAGSLVAFGAADKTSTTIKVADRLRTGGTINLVARAYSEHPEIVEFKGSENDELDVVTISLTGIASKEITKYAITTASEEGDVRWTSVGAMARSTELNESIDVRANDFDDQVTYYGWIMDSEGHTVRSEALDIYKIHFVPGSGVGDEFSIIKAAGTSVRLPLSPFTNEGYGFRHWSGTSGNYSDGDRYAANMSETLTAEWSKDTTVYEVREYIMDVNGEYPTEPEVTRYTGVCGNTINVEKFKRSNYTGLSLDEELSTKGDVALVKEETASRNVLNMYYQRNKYELSYSATNPDTKETTTLLSKEFYYGAAIDKSVVPADPEIGGYSFTAWNYGAAGILPETMPAYNINATAKFAANFVTYKVYFYEQALDGEGYVLNEELTETKNGTHNMSEPTNFDKAPQNKGFKLKAIATGYGTPDAQPPVGGEREPSLHVNANEPEGYIAYYYDRNTYTLTKKVWKGTPDATDEGSVLGFSEQIELKYGEPIPTNFEQYDGTGWNNLYDLTGYKLASYADWTTGPKPSVMPASDVTVTREYINDREVPYDVNIWLEEANGTYKKERTFTFYKNLGTSATIGDNKNLAEGQRAYTLDYNELLKAVDYSQYYQLAGNDAPGVNNVLSVRLQDPETNGGVKSTLEVYLERKTTTTKVSYRYLEVGADGKVSSGEIASGTMSGKWGTKCVFYPTAFFNEENTDSKLDNLTTTDRANYDYRSNGYVVSYSGSYWSYGDKPAVTGRLHTEASLDASYNTIFGNGDAVIRDSSMTIYYYKPNPDQVLDVSLSYNNYVEFAPFGGEGTTDKSPITIEYEGERYPLKVMNKKDIFEVTNKVAKESERYPGLASLNETATFTYGDLRDEFEEITVDGVTAYLKDGVIYYCDETNQWYLGNTPRLTLASGMPGHNYLNKFVADYKAGEGDFSDDSKYRLVNRRNYSYTSIISSTNSINATVCGTYYVNGYAVMAILDGEIHSTGNYYAENQVVGVNVIKGATIEKFKQRPGYDTKWFTDANLTNPLGTYVTIGNENVRLYGKYEKKDLTSKQYVYYERSNGEYIAVTSKNFNSYGPRVTRKTNDAGDVEYYFDDELIAVEKEIKSKTFEEISIEYEDYLKTGYHFDTKNTDNTLVGYCETTPITLKAYIARNEVKLALDPGNSQAANLTTEDHFFEEEVTLPKLERLGYTYTGWKLYVKESKDKDAKYVIWNDNGAKTNADGSVTIKMPDNDVKAVGQWVPAEFDTKIVHYFEDCEGNYEVKACQEIQKQLANDEQVDIANVRFIDNKGKEKEVTGEVYRGSDGILGVQIDDKFYRATIDNGEIVVDCCDIIMMITDKTVRSESRYLIDEDVIDDAYGFAFKFASWQGTLSSEMIGRGEKYLAEYGMTLELYYEAKTYNIGATYVSADGKPVEVTVKGAGPYKFGSSVNLSAQVGTGYEMLGWYEAENINNREDAITSDENLAIRVRGDADYAALIGATKPDIPSVSINGLNSYVYGYKTQAGDALKVKTEFPEGASDRTRVMGYQWYELVDGNWKAIEDQSASIYAFPEGREVGSYQFKCIVTIANVDNNHDHNRETKVESEVRTVNVVPDETEVTADDYNGIYDGDGHSITVNVPEELRDYEIFYSDEAITDIESLEDATKNNPEYKDVKLAEDGSVASRTVYFYVKSNNKNYNDTFGSATVTITPKSISLSRGTSAFSKVYDGTDTAEDVNVDVLQGLYTIKGLLPEERAEIERSWSVKFGSVQFDSADVDATNVIVTDLELINASGNTNYNYAFGKEDVVYLPGEITPLQIGVVWDASEYVYNGKVQGPDAAFDVASMTEAERSLVEADGIGLEVSGKSAQAGDHTATVEVTGDKGKNYEVNVSEKPYTIAKKAVVIKCADDEVTYDGEKHSLVIDSKCAEGLPEGAEIKADVEASYKDASEYQITPSNGRIYIGGKDVTENYNVSYETATLTINAKRVTADVVVESKAYDATKTASISATVDTGVEGEKLTISDLTGEFARADVGTDIAVTYTSEGRITAGEGTKASNYEVIYPAATGSITRKQINATVTASDKVYDGNTSAVVSATVDTGIAGEELVISNLTGAFDNRNAGNGKTVSVDSTNVAIAGGAGNYEVIIPNTTTASISKASLSVEGLLAGDKTYDGTTTVSVSGGRLVGIIGEDDVTLEMPTSGTVASKNVGNDISVSVTLGSLTGADAGNYELKGANALSADITPRDISVKIKNQTITYGGNEPTSYGVDLIDETTLGAGDSIADLNITFGSTYDKNDASKRGVGQYDADVTGWSNDNYNLTSTPGKLIVNPAKLTITADNKSMTYGDDDPVYTAKITGWKYSDKSSYESDITVGYDVDEHGHVGTFNIAPKTEDVVSNYTIATAKGTLTVGKKKLVLDGITGEDKVYDANTSAVINLDNARLSGIVGDDEVELNKASVRGVFANKDAGENKTINLTYAAGDLTGSKASNYTIDLENSQKETTAKISKAALTVTANNKEIKYGQAGANDGVKASGIKSPDKFADLNLNITYTYLDGEDRAYTTSSALGEYRIVPSGVAETTNYKITYAEGILNVVDNKFAAPEPVWQDEAGTIKWQPIPAVGQVSVSGYDVVLKKDGEIAATVTGTSDTSVDFADQIRANGAGKYTVTVTAVSPDTDKVASTSGTSTSIYAAKVEAIFAGANADKGDSATVGNQASYIMIAGERDVDVDATLLSAIKTGYTMSAASSSSMLTISAETQGEDCAYNSKLAMSKQLNSSADITVTITPAARPATVKSNLETSASAMVFGYENGSTLTMTANPGASDNIAADGYSYSYKWELKKSATSKYEEMQNGASNSYEFPKGQIAYNSYYVRCTVTATRIDNGQVATETLTKKLEVKKADLTEVTTELSLGGWTYGEARAKATVGPLNPNPQGTSYRYIAASSSVTEANVANETDGWTTGIPTDAGEYFVQALIAASTNYNAFETNIVKIRIEKNQLATPTNIAIAKSSTSAYGKVTWNQVASISENAGNSPASTATVTGYTATLYKLEDGRKVQVGEPIHTTGAAATSADFTSRFAEAGTYQVEVVAHSSNTGNVIDSEVGKLTTEFNVNGYISVSKDETELDAKNVNEVYDGKSIKLQANFTESGSYQWYKDGSAIDGATSATLNLKNVTDTGMYTCVLTGDDKQYSTNVYVAITKKPLTVELEVQTREYDATKTATVTGTLRPVAGESIRVSGLAGTFDNKNAGANKAVAVNSSAMRLEPSEGTILNNYQVTCPASTTGTITPKRVNATVSGSKVYDGNVALSAAKLKATVDTGIAGEKLKITELTGTYDNKNVGTNKTVTLNNDAVVISDVTAPSDPANYKVLYPETFISEITPLHITATDYRVLDKVYDGSADVVIEGGQLVGTISGDDVSLVPITAGVAADRNAGNSKKVTFEEPTLTGEDAANYVLDSYNKPTANISPRPVVITWQEKLAFAYDGKPHEVTGIVSNKQPGDSDEDFSIAYTDNVKTKDAEYTASVTSVGNANYTIKGGSNLETPWNIYRITGVPDATLSGPMKTEASGVYAGPETEKWFTGDVSIVAPEGYKISRTETNFQDAIGGLNTEGESTITYFLKEESTGAISEQKAISFKIDSQAPTGRITIGDDFWTGPLSILNSLFFYKDKAEVRIAGDDPSVGIDGSTNLAIATSGVATIEYQKVARGDTFDENGEWTENDAFRINANDSAVIYARITDVAGNSLIINSDNAVVWSEAGEEALVTITRKWPNDLSISLNHLNGNTVKNIKCDDESLTRGVDYVANADALVFAKSYLNTLAAGDHTITLEYNPGGEEYTGKGDGKNATATTFTLRVNKLPGSVTITNDPSRLYNAKPIEDTTYDVVGTGNVVVEYKDYGAADSTYSTKKPVDVGTYDVRVTKLEDADYQLAYATSTVRIDKVQPTIVVQPTFSKTYGDADFTVETQFDGDEELVFTSEDTSIATVDNNGKVTLHNAGTVTINVHAAMNRNYYAADASFTITVAKKQSTLEITKIDYEVTYGDEDFDIATISYESESTPKFTNHNKDVVSVDENGRISIKKVGKANIDVSLDESDNYLASLKEVTVTVKPRPVILTWDRDTFIYDQDEHQVNASVANIANEGDEFDLEYEENIKTLIGDYQAKVTALGNSNYTLEGAEGISHDWHIVDFETGATATVEGDRKNDSGWFTGNTYLVAPEGFKISLDAKEWFDRIPVTEDGVNELAYYVKADNGFTTDVPKDITVKYDSTSPEIQNVVPVGNNSTFTINVEKSDATSGIAKVEAKNLDENLTAELVEGNLVIGGCEAGQEYTFTLVITDVAGNVIEQEVTFVAAEEEGSVVEDEDESKQLRIVVFNGVPDVPKSLADAGYDSEDAIRTEMFNAIKKRANGYSFDRTRLYDAQLQVSYDDGKSWRLANESEFPEQGVTVTLGYPEGVSKNGYDFAVNHMSTGDKAGAIDFPSCTYGADAISVHLASLSPILVAWKVTPTVAVNTGDTTMIVLSLAIMLAAVGMLILMAIVRRKKR